MNDEALPESTELANFLLNPEQKQVIERATKEIKERPDAYDLGFFWKVDASIGGIGGYCMPFDPTCNPFPAGIGRELFRPLQYAAADIEWNKDLYSSYVNARSAVEFSGMHLEIVTKYVIGKTAPLSSVTKYRRSTLGKSIDFLEQRNDIPDNRKEPLELCTLLYNKSKHDTKQDEERERLFSPADALISYFSARIIGKELLKQYYPEIIEQLRPYLDRLHGLNLNV